MHTEHTWQHITRGLDLNVSDIEVAINEADDRLNRLQRLHGDWNFINQRVMAIASRLADLEPRLTALRDRTQSFGKTEG